MILRRWICELTLLRELSLISSQTPHAPYATEGIIIFVIERRHETRRDADVVYFNRRLCRIYRFNF